MEHLYMLSDGLFNFITGIQATFLFTFLTFSAFLRASGGDRVFADLALAAAGHRRGGPAKVAVASSALMGMLSGSTVSNVATTGTLTIPMMVRSGFLPLEAAAIETSASVGGALMPPVMGAGVFLMAAFTGVPLVTILTYSFLPAVLYFASVYFYVDVKARKRGIPPLPRESLGRVGGVLKEGGYLFLPIAVLTYLLLADYTPFFASSACVLMVVAVSYLRRETRLTPRKLLITLEASTRAVLTLSALAASSAIMYGVLTATGLLVKMTSIVLALAGGSLFVCLLYVALMSYVVGLSLPVTASYVLIAALGASALTELGLSTLAAHLVIFWFSQDATITPPVCMTAFVAARIAGTPPMRTGWESVRVAKALYLVPFLFAYGSLLSRSVTEVLFDFGAVFLGFALIPIVVEGFYRTKLDRLERVLLGLASGGLFLSALGPMSQGYRWLLTAVASAGLAHVLSRKRAAESVSSVGSGAAGS
jgi:TRAP transporter 4TM/12TM fusion protein